MNIKPVPYLIGAAMLMIATQALAQSAGGRVLQKTNLKALTPFLGGSVTIPTSFVDLLTPTAIVCPGSSTCTLHIEVSSEVNDLDAGAELRMRVRVDGNLADPGLAYVRVATNNGAAATDVNSKTFQWFETGVLPGSHMVEWQAAVSSGTAIAISRIQKINIYTP